MNWGTNNYHNKARHYNDGKLILGYIVYFIQTHVAFP